MSVKRRIKAIEQTRARGLVLIVVSPGETEAEAIQRHERHTGRPLLVITGGPDRKPCGT